MTTMDGGNADFAGAKICPIIHAAMQKPVTQKYLF